MAKKKSVSPMFQKPRAFGLGDYLTDYSQPMGNFAMPQAPVQMEQVAIPVGPAEPPTQQEATPNVQQPPSFAMDSGLSRQNQATMQNKDFQEYGSKRDIPVAPADVQAMIDATRAIPGYAEREQGLAGMEQALAGKLERAPSTVDISPLMALSDAWTGSKFAGTYKAPKSPSETIMEEMGKIQTGRKDLTQQVIDMLKIKKGQEYDKNLLELITGQKAVSGSKAPSSPKVPQLNPGTANANKRAIIGEASKMREAIQKDVEGIKSINELVKNPNLQNLGILRVKIARVLAGDVGNLAVQEQTAALPSTMQQDFKKMLAYMQGDPGVKVDEKLVENTKEVLKSVSKNMAQKYKDKITAARETWRSQDVAGVDVDAAFKPLDELTKGIEYKSDFEKFLEGVQSRKAGGK